MTTDTSKPATIRDYQKWLREQLKVRITRETQNRYQAVADRVRVELESSPFWHDFNAQLPELGGRYLVDTGYPLFISGPPSVTILTKGYDSFLHKSYRKNVLANAVWPDPPKDGWITPENWITRTNDVVRTTIVVKYMDGVKFLTDAIVRFANSQGVKARVDLEAREEGYYAAHVYLIREYEVPRQNWRTEKLEVSLEIQVTTQLQEVMRRLTHEYYEERRQRLAAPDLKWQWDYRNAEFLPNYLGHVLHYVEGMIMEVRDRQKRSSSV